MKINDVIKAKASHEVVTIGPDATVRELVALLSEHNVGALVVSDDGERVTGIVSERDVVRRLHAPGSLLSTGLPSTSSSTAVARRRKGGMRGSMEEDEGEDESEGAPAHVSDLPSYVLLVGLGVCAVVVQVVFRRMAGKGGWRP